MGCRHGNYHSKDWAPPRSSYHDQGRFGRMFSELPPFASDTPRVRHALLEIGKVGGIMDAKDNLAAGPRALLADANLSRNNPDNPAMGAGMTFLGQFIDHDLTFDPTSSLERQADPEQIANFRTPTLALDNIYGAGPGGTPHLYDQVNGGGFKFLIEETGTPGKHDLPRNSQNVALVGDPRNDENLIVSQLQLAFLLFHNRVFDYVQDELRVHDLGEAFNEAQRLVRWHYQWILIHEFLRLTCGEAIVRDVLDNGRKFYKWRRSPFIPVEFSVAAYRFGHSQVRPSYRSNFTGDGGVPLFLFIFDPASTGESPSSDDLSGARRKPWRFIDWPTFFDFHDGNLRNNKRIDTTLSTPLFVLPGSVVPNPDPLRNPQSLAQRNLLRHLTFALPSGQSVARYMSKELTRAGLDPLSDDAFSDLKDLGMNDRTPLWFYILREAQVMHEGKQLGPVGARIVAEVFIGLLEGDETSYLVQDPEWEPELPTLDPARQNEDFTMVDLLTYAGVGPEMSQAGALVGAQVDGQSHTGA